MSDIKNWSKTAINNSSAPPDGAPEGMRPSTVNDTIRKQMAIHREQWEDAVWFNWGHVPVRQSAKSFLISSTVTDIYTVERMLKLEDATTIIASVKGSSPSGANTLISITSSAGSSLTTSLSSLAVSIINTSLRSYPRATSSIPGAIELATLAEVLAGTDQERAITPGTFFNGTAASSGHYYLPGGLLINWGSGSGTSGTFTFDQAFTNLWAIVGSHQNATSGSHLRFTASGLTSATWNIDGGGAATTWYVALGN